MYDKTMSKSIQIAFTLAEEDLMALDGLVPGDFPSRAHVLRVAVRTWLDSRREADIDAALRAGYGAHSPGDEEKSWAELSVEGLAGAGLDW